MITRMRPGNPGLVQR